MPLRSRAPATLRDSIDRGVSAPALFYHGYESESGWAIEPRRVRVWEILSNVRRVIIALEQTDRYMIGGQSNPDVALEWRHRVQARDFNAALSRALAGLASSLQAKFRLAERKSCAFDG